MTLKQKVASAIGCGQSGAIEVQETTSEGGTRQPDMKLVADLLYLKSGNKADFAVDIDRKVVHPLTEEGWQALEWLATQPGWEVKPNGQRAAFANVLFQGVGVEASHDHDKIRHDQRIAEQQAREAGYGKGLWDLRG